MPIKYDESGPVSTRSRVFGTDTNLKNVVENFSGIDVASLTLISIESCPNEY